MTTRIPQNDLLVTQNCACLDRQPPPPEIKEGQNESKARVPFVGETEFSDEGQLFPQPEQSTPCIDQQQPSPNERSKPASQNSDFQAIWETIMEGVGTTEAPHKQTAVLMISWDEDLDDLDTATEVNDLSDVFTNKFRYTVVKERLTAKKLPSHQLTKHLANFIHEFDSESTLLIIYYAGHGTRGKPGELHFSGSSIAPNKRSTRNSIPWHSTENLLQGAVGDVLLIFDCCYAGNLAYHLDKQRGYWPTRSFEFLAACKKDTLTHPPGPKSFTRALIWALELLIKTREKFTTHELQTQIEKAPGFPKSQHVQVLDRGDPCDQRLVLAPLPLLSGSMKSDRTNSDIPIRQPKEYFDLRFWYLNGPDEEEVSEVANILKKLIHDEKIRANRIAWIRFGDVNHLKNIVNKWRRLPARKSISTSPDLKLDIPQLYDQSRLQSLHTPPGSQSGNSSKSDYRIEKGDPFGGHSVALQPKVLPSNQATARTARSNISSGSTIDVELPSKSVPMTLNVNNTITRDNRWVHPGVLVFIIALFSYAYKYL